MDFQTFKDNFRAAAVTARDFAREFIKEPLPDAMVYRLSLNCSYDGNPLLGDESGLSGR